MKDYYLAGKSPSLVTEDEQSNIKDHRVSYIDGQLRVSFKRKRNTGDEEKVRICFTETTQNECKVTLTIVDNESVQDLKASRQVASYVKSKDPYRTK